MFIKKDGRIKTGREIVTSIFFVFLFFSPTEMEGTYYEVGGERRCGCA